MDKPHENTLFRTTGDDLAPTVTRDGEFVENQCAELIQYYEQLLREARFSWTTHLRLMRRLGSGGQGVVYLTERRGSDGFTLPVALKIFSPERYRSPSHYDADMARIGQVAARVARVQHESLLVVENFLDRDRIRMLVMEWVEGFDLRRLLTPRMYGVLKERVSQRRWDYINKVLVTRGPQQPRFKPGVAIAIIRDCLEAIAALHRQGIVHGDIKPANIMLKRTGRAKMIDIGSAYEIDDPPQTQACTPAYAAPEILEGGRGTPLSDLASIGYVTLELLSGQALFSQAKELNQLIQAKRTILDRMHDLLPEEVICNDLLMTFCRGLVDPDPKRRFPSAEAAELLDEGAAAFHRQLIKNDMASEYENDIRIWIEELLEIQDVLFP